MSAYSCLIKEGYLCRKSSYLKLWKTKWVVLKGFCVFIFNEKPVDHKTNDVNEIYDLSLYEQIHQINQNEFELYSVRNIKNIKPTTFKTNANVETIKWVNCIRKQQNKLSINDVLNDDTETVILESIGQLMDDGFTNNEIKLALQKSIDIVEDDSDDNSDDDSVMNIDINASFDPRSMFEMEEQITKKRESESVVATALLSAINENIDEKMNEIADIECDKQILNDINYSQVSSSVQNLLLTTNIKPKTKNNNKINQNFDENVFEMKTINTMDTDISDLCVLATKQLQLLDIETNKNMIEIKKMNLIQTLNKIKQMNTLQYSNMMKDKQWSIFMENAVIS